MIVHPHQLPDIVSGLTHLAASLRSQGRVLSGVTVHQASAALQRAVDQMACEIAEEESAGEAA